MLGYISTINEDTLNNYFNKISYLEGDFDVVVYSSISTNGWIETGSGVANFSFGSTFITEKVKLINDSHIIKMNNTIGCDLEKDTFKLFSLDEGFGNMYVFKGFVSEGILTFCNIESETKQKNEIENSFCFKLIYKQISEFENELVVGCSKNKGKTWFPLLKNQYKRK